MSDLRGRIETWFEDLARLIFRQRFLALAVMVASAAGQYLSAGQIIKKAEARDDGDNMTASLFTLPTLAKGI